MMIYGVLVTVHTRPGDTQTRLVLATTDLGQAVTLARNINILGFAFDTEGDNVGVYKMERGVPLPASVFNTPSQKPYPVIYWREKDKDLEWVDGWASERDRQECLAAAV